MTVTTNALLQGRVARTALIATDGFTDVIELARQARPHLYRLCDAPPGAARARRAALRRARAHDARRTAARARPRRRARAHRSASPPPSRRPSPSRCCTPMPHPRHERLLGELIAELLPGVHLSLSSDVVGTFREFERTATTALDAALSPLLADYLRRLAGDAASRELPEPQIMQSSGGLTDVARASAHAALTVLSGPAGGVGGAQLLAQLAGEPDVLCFDMGGTSCDACLIERRRGRRDRRARDRRPPARAARAGHRHRRRRRRLDRLARLRRRAARRPAVRGRRPRARLLRPRRRGAHGHRRQPAARPAAHRRAARRRPARSTATPPSAPSRAWPASCTWMRWPAPKASCAWPSPRCSARCACSPSSAASTRAASR